MKIQAEYQITNFKCHTHYQCRISNLPHFELKNIKLQGQHITGKNRQDVTVLKFINCMFCKLPQKFSKIFPNLKNLLIWDSALMELTKFDLAEYKELEEIDIRRCMLSSLPGDIFEGFKHIKYIHISSEQLQTIEPNILDGLFSLEFAHFKLGNEESENYVKGHQSYKKFRDDLRIRFCTSDQEVISNYIKKIEQNVSKFKKMKENLNGKVQGLEAANEVLTDRIDELEIIKNFMDIDVREFLFRFKIENDKIWLKRIESIEEKYKIGIYGDFDKYIKDETTKDFVIIIGSQEFKVHKFLLAARIPTLGEIIKNNPEINCLNLVGITVESFEAIMRFLYTDDFLGEEEQNFLDLLSAAGKLKIAYIKKQVALLARHQLNLNNSLKAFKLGCKYEETELSEAAFGKVKLKYPKIKFQDEWINDPAKVEEVIENFEKKEKNENHLKKIQYAL